MANDPTTLDQQVADRPGQTAPIPVPAGLQPDTETHPMLTADGTQSGEVPISQMAAARAQGHHIAIPMQAPDPDNRTGLVPLHRWTEAAKAGFKHIGAYKNAIDSAMDYVRDKRNDLAEAANYAITKHIPNFDSMPPEVQNDLKTMVGVGVGFYTGGVMAPGMSSDEAKAAATDIKRPLTSTLPPLGLSGTEIEPSEPSQQLGRVPQRADLNRPALPSGEPGTRTIDVQATAPGEYAVPEKVVSKTPSGQDIHVPPERTAGVHDEAIKAGGAIPGGIQKGDPDINLTDLVLFHDPETGSTLALPPDKVSPENISKQLENSRAQFAAVSNQKVPIAAEDQRIELRNAQNRTARRNAVREDRMHRQQEFEAAQPKANGSE